MVNLTDRQRFALRESLCDVLADYSDVISCSSWDAEAVIYAKTVVLKKGCDDHLVGLVELLGEWPVGFRGQDGWEKIECKS